LQLSFSMGGYGLFCDLDFQERDHLDFHRHPLAKPFNRRWVPSSTPGGIVIMRVLFLKPWGGRSFSWSLLCLPQCDVNHSINVESILRRLGQNFLKAGTGLPFSILMKAVTKACSRNPVKYFYKNQSCQESTDMGQMRYLRRWSGWGLQKRVGGKPIPEKNKCRELKNWKRKRSGSMSGSGRGDRGEDKLPWRQKLLHLLPR